jgi:N-acetylneuraminic acid mutarotase
VAAGAIRAEINLSRGLILHYPFNGSAEDASGAGRHGTLGGSAGNATFVASDRLPADPAKGAFTVTGNLVQSRHSFAAAILPSGQVLAAGGLLRDETPLASAEIYSAASGTWSLTGPMAAPRAYPVSAILPDGRVLIAGGLTQLNPSLPSATAELYDPRTGTWSAAGSLAQGRVGLTLTTLGDGRVLATGGWYRTASGATVTANTAEVFDPRTGAWSAAGVMTAPRVNHTATLLPDGRVLVAGGGSLLKPAGSFYSIATAEIFDPVAGTWTATGSLREPREQHLAELLASGQVLVAGGGQDNSMRFLATAELYDPTTGLWRPAASMSVARQLGASAVLPSGHMLIAGGDANFATHATAEIYEPARDRWVATGSMSGVRHSHRAVRLRDGRVLMIGGYDSNRTPPNDGRLTELFGLGGTGLRIIGHEAEGYLGGGHVVLPSLAGVLGEEFTLSIWSKGEQFPIRASEAYFALGTEGAGSYWLRLEVGGFLTEAVPSTIGFVVGGGPQNVYHRFASAPLTAADAARWKHLVLVKDALGFRGYIDGVLIGSVPLAFSLNGGSFNAIGRHWWWNGAGSSARLSAELDEARIYNRALPEAEIRALFAQAGAGLEQTLTFAALPARTFGDVPFSLVASASSGLPVSFAVVSGPATLSGNQLTLTGAGEVTLRARQEGDGTFASAVPVDRTFTVARAAQSISFTSAAQRTFGEAPFLLSATASSGLPVSFSLISGPATLSGALLTLTGPGTVVVRAAQAGGPNHLAAPAVDQSITVQDPLLSGLAAWWRLEGDGVDAQGTSPGSAQNISWVERQVGLTTKPVAFLAGSTAVAGLNVAKTPALNLPLAGYTLMGWVYSPNYAATTGNAFYTLIDGQGSSPGNPQAAAYNLFYGRQALNFQVSSLDNYPGFDPNYRHLKFTRHPDGSGTILEAGRWHLIAVTWDGAVFRGYVDGTALHVQGNAAAVTAPPKSTSRVTTLGMRNFGTTGTDNPPNNGYLSDVRIYHRPLSATELVQLYERQMGPVRPAQAITFPALADRTFGEAPFTLAATASSGLPVSYAVVAGPATISGSTLTLTGIGRVTLRASQPGTAAFSAAADVEQAFLVKAPADATLPVAGLIAYYPFSGSAQDASVHANHGVVSGAVLTADRFGRSNSAYAFNGVDAHITVPHAERQNSLPITVAGWIRPDELRSAQVVNKYANASWNGWAVVTGNDPVSTPYLFPLYLSHPSNVIGGYGNPAFGADRRVDDQAWHHFAFTVDAGGGKFYLDGALVSERAWVGTPQRSTSTGPLRFGANAELSTAFFKGAIDDVAIYDRALTAAEVRQLTAAASELPAAGVPAWPQPWVRTGPPTNRGDLLRYANGRFLTLGHTSVDGQTWTAIPPPPHNFWLNEIGEGDGTYVITGPQGQLWTSPDLAAWTRRTTPDTDDLTAVAHGNGVFVVRKFWQAGAVLRSADRGVTWQTVATGPAPDRFYNTLAFGQGLFVYALDTSVRTSLDGLAWQDRPVSGVPPGFSLNRGGLAFTGREFVTAGESGSTATSRTVVVGTSPNGSEWTFRTAVVPGTRPLRLLGASEGRVIIGGSNAQGSSVWLSTDSGTSWTDVSLAPYATDSSLARVVFAAGKAVMAGAAGLYTATASGGQFQTIDFPAIAARTFRDPSFLAPASASSGLPVQLAVVSGPARVVGRTVTLEGAGTVVLRATQPGDDAYAPAAPVERTFTVAKATPVLDWPAPASVALGTVLGPTQLNATATPGGGTFTYLPAAGAVLNTPGPQVLSVAYAPLASDGANYASVTLKRMVTVSSAPSSPQHPSGLRVTRPIAPVEAPRPFASGWPILGRLPRGSESQSTFRPGGPLSAARVRRPRRCQGLEPRRWNGPMPLIRPSCSNSHSRPPTPLDFPVPRR